MFDKRFLPMANLRNRTLDSYFKPLGLWATLVGFGVLFALISVVNHHLFRTSALDLGMMNHALHSFSEFQSNTYTLGLRASAEKPFMGTHFSPIMFLYVPIYWILGNSSLLWIQIGVILLGGVAMHRIARSQSNDSNAIWSVIHFLTIWGIYSALEFDFHNNVVGAMLVPWLWVFLSEQRKIPATLVMVMILACQENMGLWMVFVITGFLMHEKRLFKARSFRFEWPLVAFSALYFFLALTWFMPTIAGELHSSQLSRYSHWGDGLLEIAGNLLAHPVDALEQLFTSDHRNAPAKMEFHVMMLVAGGWACLRHPHFLWMLIPIYAQKMLSNAPEFWGVGRQYSIEFVPIIALAAMTVANKWPRSFRILYPLLCLVTFGSTILKTKHRKDYFKRENVDFFYSPHYMTNLKVDLIQEVLDDIPADIPLSVSSSLSPHLANRECIRMFPLVKDAEMIVLLTKAGHEWPLSRDEFEHEVQRLRASKDHVVLTDESDILVLQVLPKP